MSTKPGAIQSPRQEQGLAQPRAHTEFAGPKEEKALESFKFVHSGEIEVTISRQVRRVAYAAMVELTRQYRLEEVVERQPRSVVRHRSPSLIGRFCLGRRLYGLAALNQLPAGPALMTNRGTRPIAGLHYVIFASKTLSRVYSLLVKIYAEGWAKSTTSTLKICCGRTGLFSPSKQVTEFAQGAPS